MDDFFRLTIGAEYREGDDSINPVRGRIDDFAVFGNALDEEEIARLAGGESVKTISGSATPFIITAVVVDDDTVAFLRRFMRRSFQDRRILFHGRAVLPINW